MPNSSTSQVADAVQLALTAKRLEDVEEQLKELKADRDKFLRWGVITLGGAVVGLVTWIFNIITRQP